MDLHPLTAGQGAHGPRLLEQGGGKAQTIRRFMDLPRRQSIESAGALHIGAYGQGFLLSGQFLGKIPHLAVHHALAPDLGVALHHAGVVYPFEQSGFAVALLADEGGPLPLVQRKGQIVYEQPVVLAGAYGHISDLQHICLLIPRSKSTSGRIEKACGRDL